MQATSLNKMSLLMIAAAGQSQSTVLSEHLWQSKRHRHLSTAELLFYRVSMCCGLWVAARGSQQVGHGLWIAAGGSQRVGRREWVAAGGS